MRCCGNLRGQGILKLYLRGQARASPDQYHLGPGIFVCHAWPDSPERTDAENHAPRPLPPPSRPGRRPRPTGRNLYGFNPAKLPSPAAWELGKKAGDEIIAQHLQEHGRYPDKVAVVLWATETLRNEGVNESTVLWLMGIRPKWHPSGRLNGLEVVPGQELGRPRIDVLISASGLYRDLFPDKMELLD